MTPAFLLTLLVATSAQDGDSSQGQGAQSQGAQDAQQKSYATESYAHESYAEPVAPKCCVSYCPEHAPFFNTHTCSCVPGLANEEYHEHYATASYEVAGDQPYEGGEQQSGYRQLNEFVSASHPAGTIDTRNRRIRRVGTIVLWVVFALLFIAACYYLRMFWYYYTIAELGDTIRNLPDGIGSSIYFHLANPSLRAGMVCLIASLAYLTMASGNGWYTRCHDGRQFFYARYIDWIVTTPLMLHAIAHFANSPDEIWNFLMFSDIIMIVAGLIASTITGVEKWIYFAFAILAFIPILYYICHLKANLVDNRRFDRRTGLVSGNAIGNNGQFLPYIWFWHTYHTIADLTVVAWFIYPIVWIFAEGDNAMSVTAEAITYAILDLISKVVFGWFIVNSEFSNPRARFVGKFVDRTENFGPD